MIVAQMTSGMQWIPLILLALASGLGIGAISILASVFQTHSHLGRVAGWAAVAIGCITPLLLASLTGRNLDALGYLILASPAAVGLIGIALTRMPAGRTLTLWRMLIVTVTASTVLTLGYLWWQHAAASRQMLRLLGGSDDVRIVELETSGQQRRVICSDPAICAYITQAFRNAKGPGQGSLHGPGGSYLFALRFSTGQRYKVRGDTHSNGLSLMVPEVDPYDDGWDTHDIVFGKPLPQRLSQILDFLAEPNATVQGSELIVVGDGPPRVEHPVGGL